MRKVISIEPAVQRLYCMACSDAGLLAHPYMQEAEAIVKVFTEQHARGESDPKMMGVIGTSNDGPPKVQLYGWRPNVAKHADDTGWIYLVPLVVGRSRLHAGRHAVDLERGSMYVLNDWETHWTVDDGPVVCLFAGVFEERRDVDALQMLLAGLEKLVSGADDAPRVAPGFQVPLPDECYAMVGDYPVLMKHARALRENLLVAPCAKCDRPAIKLDSDFPYHCDLNRCAEHLATPDACPVVPIRPGKTGLI